MWLKIGIGGVTCGGKSTLSSLLYNYFSQNKEKKFLNTNLITGDVFLISQDDYFLPMTDSRHKWIENLKHINWEILSAIDMEKMIADIEEVLSEDFQFCNKEEFDFTSTSDDVSFQNYQRINILVIEGFLIFNCPQIFDFCQLKFYLHLPYEKCIERRRARIYNPADVTGYFEMCVWPMYEKHFREISGLANIEILNGEISKENMLKYILGCIENFSIE